MFDIRCIPVLFVPVLLQLCTGVHLTLWLTIICLRDGTYVALT